MSTRLLLAPVALLATLLLAGSAPAPAAESEAQCHAPQDLLSEDEPPLPITAERFKTRAPLTIVAIGGASTAGAAAGGDPDNAYPHRLEEALQRRHPGQTVAVINKGMPRQTSADMVERFPRDVIALAPSLVVWETGTVDAVRGVDLDRFADTLRTGIAALRARKLDIVLVNMQYNSGSASVIDFEPYLDALRRAAELDGVYLFRRFEIMRSWSESGRFDFAAAPKEARTALAVEVYRCLGETLAAAIDGAAR